MKVFKIFALSVGIVSLVAVPAVAQQATQSPPDTVRKSLTGKPTADGAQEAYCELVDKQGDVYRGARIMLKNNDDRQIRCTVECNISRTSGADYPMKCTGVSLSPKQDWTQVCSGSSSTFEYKGISGGGYECVP